jgi:hypothetical protein
VTYNDDEAPIEIVFDPAKDRANRAKHGVSLARAAQLFAGRHVDQIDETMNYGEERWNATGMVDGNFLTCAYTARGRSRRIISLRRATRREIKTYFQAG